ncbi:MAG TPA: hypothetical protein VMW70_08535 [Burkholderiales bacterium]|nr:hypothetical protein [Burkholderiales bacterium]
MMMRKLVVLAVLLASSPAQAVDLLDIYREARINDTRTAAARAHYRGMQERIPQARAGWQESDSSARPGAVKMPVGIGLSGTTNRLPKR